jgi:hypothetical protein
MNAADEGHRRRNRFIIVWMVGTALWLAAMLIAEATVRPPPGFAVMAPLVAGVPALALVIGLIVVRWRSR